jgi:hypothetical protein
VLRLELEILNLLETDQDVVAFAVLVALNDLLFGDLLKTSSVGTP